MIAAISAEFVKDKGLLFAGSFFEPFLKKLKEIT